jgi:hypothetical protein
VSAAPSCFNWLCTGQIGERSVDVPLAEDLAALEWRGVPRRAFEAFCDEVGGDGGLRVRPHRYAETER